MKIHVLGASCSGTTTLGMVLSEHVGCPYFDSDQYFWKPSEPPFTIRREPHERNAMLHEDLLLHDNWIIGGSVINWGEEWLTAFDLVVFLYIPPAIRLQRLKNRELERYGDVIFTNPERALQYQQFLEWATAYDTDAISGRTLKAHEAWLSKLSCSVLEIRGDTSVQERLNLVLGKL
ncbi:adenylate kinase [Mucilaginibacter robiniae]|uniref:Adenylate kinase n=1 Tax=Mucilaginibacter robiniae TaxID=2728022 RepID=A0A7L5E412_9SPHI|nr:adenylate kinase [Mucilaginibacter robiniae]QJD95096.1 adenylate kinase [Mucilaginibacter robiniae]